MSEQDHQHEHEYLREPAEAGGKTLLDWVKSNALNLFVTMFLIGGAYGGIAVSNNWRDDRISKSHDEIEKLNVRQEITEKALAQVQFQTAANSVDIRNLVNDSKSLQQTTSKIEAQLDVVNTKMDTMLSSVKSLEKKMDEQQRH